MTQLRRHCQSGSVSREIIANGPDPPRTRRTRRVSHHLLLQTVESAVTRRKLNISNQAHCLWNDKRQYFGLLELSDSTAASDYSIILGIQNSYDGALPTSLILGHRVLINDNLTFFDQHVLNPHDAPLTDQTCRDWWGKP